MQDDTSSPQPSVAVFQFINFVKKAVFYAVHDFDKIRGRRYDREFLPDDGDLSSAPSMQKRLEARTEQEAYLFMRSDGKGEPMLIYRTDLAEAMEELAPKELDFLIKHFQEGMPVALYAAEEGISPSMAFRRKKGILHRLWTSITRRMRQNERKSKTYEKKNGEQA